MHSVLTELMMHDRAAELQGSTDRIVLPDDRWVALRRGDRSGLVGLFARLSILGVSRCDATGARRRQPSLSTDMSSLRLPEPPQ